MKNVIYENAQWYFDEEAMHSKHALTARRYYLDRNEILKSGDVIEHLAGKTWVDLPLAIDCYLHALQYYKHRRLPNTFALSAEKQFVKSYR